MKEITEKAKAIAETLVAFLRGEGSEAVVQLSAIGATRRDRAAAWRLANLVLAGGYSTVADAVKGAA